MMTSLVRRVRFTLTVGLGLGVVAGLLTLAGRTGLPADPGGSAPSTRVSLASGSFTPTREEWAGLRIEPVALQSFWPQEIAEGNIAIDDDRTTPVFSPYSGRVVQLIAKLGDKVERGAPLFAVEATEF